jgi:16S rRNA (cytosine1402-N4)-methyltransferase
MPSPLHVPVLLAESLSGLGVKPSGVYIDATAGLGNHTGAIAQRLETGRVFASDRDAESLELARQNTLPWAGCIHYSAGEFSSLALRLQAAGFPLAHGLLADLGVSRMQLTTAERGFSFQADGPLDMRMNRASDSPTAADLVNQMGETELANLIYQYGEEGRSRQIARAIVRGRPLATTGQLARLIATVVPRTSKIDPATRTFQALRIAVNQEFEEINALLDQLPALLREGGRVCLISFHSLEDRILKQRLQAFAKAGLARLVNKHVIPPAPEEIRNNPASRSAKLRIAEWTGPRLEVSHGGA